jgi:hypothetical protein
VKGEDGGFVGGDARQGEITQCGTMSAVDVDEVGGSELRHARDIEGTEKVDVVKSNRSGDAPQKFFDMRSARHEHRIFLRHIAAEDSGSDVSCMKRVAQAVHLDLTAAGMAVATVHEQDIHDASARRSNVRMG